jgi:GTP-binding protein
VTEASVGDRLGFVSWAPAIRVSAKTGARVNRIPAAVEATLAGRRTRVPTGALNRELRSWAAAHPPPVRKGRRPKVHYAVQAGTAPPTFVLFVSGGELGADYLRFVENRLRESHDFTGNPIHMVTRTKARRD